MDKKEQLEEKILKLDKYIQRTRFPIHIDMFYSEEIEEMDKLVDEANDAMDKLVEYFKKVEERITNR